MLTTRIENAIGGKVTFKGSQILRDGLVVARVTSAVYYTDRNVGLILSGLTNKPLIKEVNNEN